METIELIGLPMNSGDIVRDFCALVELNGQPVIIGRHVAYKSGVGMFRFYEGKGKLVGLEVFRPVSGSLTGAWRGTRISPQGVRSDLGLFTNNQQVDSLTSQV